MKYDPQSVERRWQAYWQEQQTFRAPNPGEAAFEPDRPKCYVLAMFPYPSGAGMHMGHALNYTSTDILARYERMRGRNVLHPIGFDAFGLPAEQYAVEHNVHPAETTQANIDIITRQLERLGLGFDWSRTFATTEPDYYKWTQWIFLKLYESWFDPDHNGARPIHELEQKLSNGEYDVGPDGELVAVAAMGAMDALGGPKPGTRKWQELSPEQQRNLLDEYRLAYLAEVPVNWCPALGTVLANEEVTPEGKSERGNHPVYQRPLKQWMLRITAYAERLLAELNMVDWPEPIRLMQRNWIGRSEGAEVHFDLIEPASPATDRRVEEDMLTVFTTRPDTLFGATYMVLAPEHPLVDDIASAEQYHAVNEYRKEAEQRSEFDRAAENREKTGVFTGAYAVNPVNGEQIPIWIADYVMMGYGTGAIMAVPAHDERDFAFAEKHGLPIRVVVEPGEHWLKEHAPKAAAGNRRELYLASPQQFDGAFTGEGKAINSANEEISLDGQPTAEAKQLITQWLEQKQRGRGTVQYKLRDWLFSRQRYWGEPFPIVHTPDGQVKALDESELPVELPEMEDFRPQASDDPDEPPRPPLSRAPDDWKYVQIDGQRCQRELNTMPQWAGSCWYYLRFCDARNSERFADEEAEQYWMGQDMASPTAPNVDPRAPRQGVDMYIGGVEHAVLHLLYARFWHKVLYDLGEVSTAEPFGRLYNQGYIQAHAYTDQRGMYVPADEVEEKNGEFFHHGQPVRQEFGKMGKSLKNSVTPDEVIEKYGADSLRLYLMYLGPLDQSKVWRHHDIVGVHRFLQRLWRNIVDENSGELRISDDEPDEALRRKVHQTIKRVNDGMEGLSFNVAIAALIELNNELVALDRVPREAAETLLCLLAPLAPHICEQLWDKLGYEPSIADVGWPEHDPELLVAEQIEMPVQVNGKVRGRIQVPADADEAAVEEAARNDQKIAAAIAQKTIRKVVVVPNKMVNIVAS